MDATCIIATKAVKYVSNFSLNSVLRRPSITIELKIMPAIDKASISHLSGLDACKMRLSKHARRKRKNSDSQASIQYLVTTFFRMKVNDRPEIVHIIAVKTKGGSIKTNWKIFKTTINADKIGYFSTACPRVFFSSRFCFTKFRLRFASKIAQTMIHNNKRKHFPVSFS